MVNLNVRANHFAEQQSVSDRGSGAVQLRTHAAGSSDRGRSTCRRGTQPTWLHDI